MTSLQQRKCVVGKALRTGGNSAPGHFAISRESQGHLLTGTSVGLRMLRAVGTNRLLGMGSGLRNSAERQSGDQEQRASSHARALHGWITVERSKPLEHGVLFAVHPCRRCAALELQAD